MNESKKQLFAELDRAFAEHGYAAGLSNPGFHPHYAEVEGADNVRPTWYSLYEFDGLKVFSMYETVSDLVITNVFAEGKMILSAMHTNYPRNIEDAKKLVGVMYKKIPK